MSSADEEGKRILVVSSFWPVDSNPIRGIFVVQQSRALVELGCDVTVVCVIPRPGQGSRPLSSVMVGLTERVRLLQARPFNVPHGRIVRPMHISVRHGLTSSPRRFTLNAWFSGRAIDHAVQRIDRAPPFDGVLVHGIVECGLSLPQWLPRLSAPVVVTFHGEDPYLATAAGSPAVGETLNRAWKLPAAICLVGHALRPYAQKLHVPEERLQIIHNGTELPPLDSCSRPQNPMSAKRLLLSVSRLIKWKGIQINLRAMAILAQSRPDLNWEYQVIGEGPERAALEQEARDLGIGDRVFFLGQLEHDETMRRMAQCDVFALPSWREPFGLVYLEAMARQRPVLGCLDAGAQEIVHDGVHGRLVQAKDVKSLSAALEELLCDPATAATMGQAARLRASEFSWVANARRYLAHFD